MESAKASLKHLQQHKKFEPVMLLCFGPSMKECPCVMLLLKTRSVLLCMPCCQEKACDSKDFRIRSIRSCVRFLLRFSQNKNVRFDTILFWGHGSGWVLGTWKKPDDFLSFTELNKELLVPFRPSVVAFDACFMGSFSTLFGIDSSVRYVIASPGLQPYYSFLDCKAFFPKRNQSKLSFAIRLANEWLTKSIHATHDKERCMLVFDVRFLQTRVAPLIKKHWSSMKFDKRAQVHHEEARIFDVWTASRHLPHIQRLIRKAILNVPEHKSIPCWRVRGVTVDSKVFRKWVHLYDQSRWAKFLGSGHKTHHTIPRKDPTLKHEYEYGKWLPHNLSARKRKS